MCDNREYTWFEVLRDTCGKYDNPFEGLLELCDVHLQIAKEQFQESHDKKMKEINK